MDDLQEKFRAKYPLWTLHGEPKRTGMPDAAVCVHHKALGPMIAFFTDSERAQKCIDDMQGHATVKPIGLFSPAEVLKVVEHFQKQMQAEYVGIDYDFNLGKVRLYPIEEFIQAVGDSLDSRQVDPGLKRD